MRRKFRRITFEDRLKIKQYLDTGMSFGKIGTSLGFCTTTISLEVKRGSPTGRPRDYDPAYSNERAKMAREGIGRVPILENNRAVAGRIAKMILVDKLTVPEVTKRLAVGDCNNPKCPISINTIYRAIDEGLIPGVSRETLIPTKSKMSSGGFICIPQGLRQRFDFRDGDIFEIEAFDDGKIVLTKLQKS